MEQCVWRDYCHCMTACVVSPVQPLVGVVYNYASDEMYAAARGKGAMLNGRQIHVSGCTSEH